MDIWYNVLSDLCWNRGLNSGALVWCTWREGTYNNVNVNLYSFCETRT